jgi:NAD(P)-dependent dehydrogenase (short-subunit alcohol dehydrogenase family)
MNNRKILVTGSGSGIGAAIARRLAGEGARIMLHARENRAGCEAVARELRERGAEVAIQLGDLQDPATPEALVDATVERFGGLDVLVANAGFPVLEQLGELTRADLDRCYAVIQAGLFQMATRARPPGGSSRSPPATPTSFAPTTRSIRPPPRPRRRPRCWSAASPSSSHPSASPPTASSRG